MRILFLFVLAGVTLHAQNYPVKDIDPVLLKNADAVIRTYNRSIEIKDLDHLIVTKKRVVTVMNKDGDSYVRAMEFYDESSHIKDQLAIIYDKNGEEIDKIKSRDFKDQSNFPSFILFSDNRVSYLDYTPRSYPYTVEYISEVEDNNSVFIGDWVPVEGYDVSVESSSFKLLNPENIPVRFTERNFDNTTLVQNNSGSNLDYRVIGLPAYQYEVLSPDFDEFAPRVLVALNEFELEEVKGTATNWEEFGKWMYDNLVRDHDELSAATVSKIKSLTANAKTTEEKAKIIYKYVQENTRYIAVSYGIGGWEPSTAREVDRLKYGDCKGLTNYTKALLKSQGIDSYYTVVFGGEKRNIDPDFAKMQGNHVILNIPQKDTADIWLECTSQESPFNYLGDFTDDRYVLLVKPEGGELVKTKRYSEEENLETINCRIKLDENGGFVANFERNSYGIPYGDIYRLQKETEKDRKKYYRNEWGDIQNINFNSIEFEDNREEIKFSEKLNFSGDGLASKAGSRLLVPLNFIQQGSISIEKNSHRKRPLMMKRGHTYNDEFVYKLPQGYGIEALPESQFVESEFGSFSLLVTPSEENEIKVIRSLMLKEGEWPAEKYNEFRKFLHQISYLNNLKAVIIANTKT